MNKQVALSFLVNSAMAAKTAVAGMGVNEPNLVLNAWVDGPTLTGALTFLLLLFFFYAGLRALINVEVPAYQIQGQDSKKQDNVREWSQIWGHIEK